MFEIQILFHLFSNVRHRLIKIYKKGSHDKRFCIKTWHKKESITDYQINPSDKMASVSILSRGKNRLLREFLGGITTSIGAPISGHL